MISITGLLIGENKKFHKSLSVTHLTPHKPINNIGLDMSDNTRNVPVETQHNEEDSHRGGNVALKDLRRALERLVESVVNSVAPAWHFQTGAIEQARSAVLTHLVDDIFKVDSMTPNILNRKKLRQLAEIPSLIKHVHKHHMAPYRKWCKLVLQKGKHPSDEDRNFGVHAAHLSTLEERLVADMILLHAVYVEIDILRSQNNFTMLMFHACKQYFSNRGRTDGGTIMDREKEKHERRYGPLQDYTHVGSFVRSQALYMYHLMNYTGFTRTERNERFFCWSDMNTLCATIPFVRVFLKWFSFQRCFKLRHEHDIHRKTVSSMSINDLESDPELRSDTNQLNGIEFQPPLPQTDETRVRSRHQRLNTRELSMISTPIALKPIEIQMQIHRQRKAEKKIAKQRAKEISQSKRYVRSFVRRWKTYYDRGGTIIGYFSLLHCFAWQIYLQLLCFSATMYVFVDMPTFENVLSRPIATAIVCSPPLVLLILLILIQLTVTCWISRPWRNPYHAVLPNRSRGSYRFGYQINYVIVILTLLSSCAVLRLMMLESLLDVTKDIIQRIDELSVDPWTLISFCLSWLPLFAIYWTISPILFTLISATLGFIIGLITRSNRITTWEGFARAMRDDRTITLFQRKLLGRRNRHLEIEQVMYRFAIFFNGLINDLYEDHLCSHKQCRMLSFQISKFHDEQTIPIAVFRKQVYAITSFVPKSEKLRRTLCKWLNNLHQRGLPDVIDVEHMSRINFITPVFNETIMYGWEELTRPTNTDTSLLRFMIEKWPREWRSFSDHRKNSPFRSTLIQLEQLAIGGGEIRNLPTPPYLKQQIRLWVSKRFQPVARTVEGVCKMAKALKLLLKVQTLQCRYTDEQLDAIVRDKFMYIIGAQMFDPSTRTDGVQMPQDHVEDWMFLLSRHGTYMKLAFQRQINGRWEGVLLGKQPGSGEAILLEKRISMFGRFDVMGHGKPCHQAFLMQFVDGKILCCIDSNQDANMAQLVFMPNALEEFRSDGKLKVLGFPEHIFTKDWSLAGYSAALVEQVFGSLVQRAWATMGMRLHYGHPDLIDARWAMFTTGLSHLSYVSEDIFTGFDTLLNNGRIGYVNYIEMAKARDVCLFTTSKFNRKTAGGAAQMALSRQVRELMTGFKLNPAEKFSFMWSVFGHYCTNLLVVLCTFASALIGIALVVARLVATLGFGVDFEDKIWGSISVVVLMQLGLTLSVPGLMALILDSGWKNAIVEYVFKLRFVVVSVYSIMHMLQQALFFHNGLIHPAQYIPSGRGAGLSHESIGKIVIAFDNTHFLPAVWLFILGVVGACLRDVGTLSLQFAYVLIIALVWLYAPLVFNRGSFPFETGLDVWARLYGVDLEYVLKFKIRHIISELSKRKKDIKRIEQHQRTLTKAEETIMNANSVDWLTDVQRIDERALMRRDTYLMQPDEESPSLLEEGYNVGIGQESSSSDSGSHVLLQSTDQDEEDDNEAFKYRPTRTNSNGILSFLRTWVLWCKVILWNTLLLFVLVGLKTASLLFALLMLVNPFHAPAKMELQMVERRKHSVERRLLSIQRIHHSEIWDKKRKEGKGKHLRRSSSFDASTITSPQGRSLGRGEEDQWQ